MLLHLDVERCLALIRFVLRTYSARSNIIARTSHLLRRLKNSTYASHRQLQGLLARATDGRTEAESARIAELQAYLARSDAMLRVRPALSPLLTRSRPTADALIVRCAQWIFDRCFDSLIIGGSYPRTYVALRLLGLVIASSACADYPVFAADVQSLPGLKASTEAPSKGNGPAGDILWPARVELFAEDVAGRERVRKVVRCLKSTFTDIRVCALSMCVLARRGLTPAPGVLTPTLVRLSLLQPRAGHRSPPRPGRRRIDRGPVAGGPPLRQQPSRIRVDDGRARPAAHLHPQSQGCRPGAGWRCDLLAARKDEATY